MRRRAARAGVFAALQEVYGGFQETRCAGCARCCFESPGLFYVEYLRLTEWLRRMPRGQREEMERCALRELLFGWIEPERSCLFLEANRCTIYAERPLACRLFGLSSPSDPDQAQEEMRLAAEEEADRLSWYGIDVPDATLGRALAKCDRVRAVRGRLRKVDPDALAERVAAIDAGLLPEAVVREEYCFRSLPDRLGAQWFGDAVELLRMQVVRRAQRGEPIEELVPRVWEMRKGGTRKRGSGA